ncbi:MAG: ornithine carbamoyltransferase [Solirubrobacteraceae bacterium]
MAIATTPRHVLRVADLSAAELEAVLDLAARMKADPGACVGALPGRALACVFDPSAALAAASLSVAAHRLGMLPLALGRGTPEVEPGVGGADSARVLSGFAAAMAAGAIPHGALEQLAAHAQVPVINVRSADHDPCQALADLLTLRERFGRLHRLKVAYLGDGGGVANSLLEAGALAGVSVVIACPRGREPGDEAFDRAFHLQEDHGGTLEVTHDADRALAHAHAVYAGAWASEGDEVELEPFRVTAARMTQADPDAIFMHCLPARRGREVDDVVIDGPRSAVWHQAANRVPTAQALVYALVSGDWGGEAL